MKNKKLFIAVLGVVIILLLIAFIAILSVKPLVRKKIMAALNKENSDFTVTIDRVKTSIIPPGLQLEKVSIVTKKDYNGIINIKGVIESVTIKGISLTKAISGKGLRIRNITFSGSSFRVNITSPRDTVIPFILPVNTKIGIVLFDKVSLSVEKGPAAASYSITDGFLKLCNVHTGKHNTLSAYIINLFDFRAEEIILVSPDSMNTYKARGISYSSSSNALDADSFFILPNYADYDFTSRYDFQTNRIEAGFRNIHADNFNIADFIRSGNVITPSVNIGEMDMKVFRDKRKEFRHISKPVFQDMIYNYPAIIRIDSISLNKGNVIYTVHAGEANNPGFISLNGINAEIYNITNDTVYKTRNDSIKLAADALLMGKGKMTVSIKARLFDSRNRFSFEGTLSEMDAGELNPILEKSAFIYATSGKIESMNFSFTADNNKATGKLTLLYQSLEIAVKNKQTDETTAFRERFISYIANIKVMDSNPLPEKEVRVGTIYFERDPERFLFHYCFRSVLSGITSSILKNPKSINM